MNMRFLSAKTARSASVLGIVASLATAGAPLASSLVVAATALSSDQAEARIGSRRGSSGFRGSRGFTQPSRPQGSPMFGRNPYTRPQQPGNSGSSGAFTRGLMGGLAGGMLGSMLFGRSGYGGYGYGGGGIGLFDILLFGGLIYFLFRMVSRRRHHGMASATPWERPRGGLFGGGLFGGRRDVSPIDKLRGVEPGPFARGDEINASSREVIDVTPTFDVASFKDEAMDVFIQMQAAWGRGDLSPVRDRLAPELLREVERDLEDLRARGHSNRIEDIAVRGAELIEAWDEDGREYATLRITASLRDYVIDQRSGEVIEGSRDSITRFDERWTFVRDLGARSGRWRLTAIEQDARAA